MNIKNVNDYKMDFFGYKASVKLTDAQWFKLIFGNRIGAKLKPCCANIEQLRDEIIAIFLGEGEVNYHLAQHIWDAYDGCKEGHEGVFDDEKSVLFLLMKQIPRPKRLSWLKKFRMDLEVIETQLESLERRKRYLTGMISSLMSKRINAESG